MSDIETAYQVRRREAFIRDMIKRFGIRWHTVCEKGKIRFMKNCFYAGYNARDKE